MNRGRRTAKARRTENEAAKKKDPIRVGRVTRLALFVCDSIGPVTDKEQILSELNAARQARSAGNEGMARVCARRAAGWAIGVRFHDQISPAATANAYLLLAWLKEQEAVDESLRAAADRLTTRITEDHELPHPEDPLEDAAHIVRAMLDGEAE